MTTPYTNKTYKVDIPVNYQFLDANKLLYIISNDLQVRRYIDESDGSNESDKFFFTLFGKGYDIGGGIISKSHREFLSGKSWPEYKFPGEARKIVKQKLLQNIKKRMPKI